jgi:importin-7
LYGDFLYLLLHFQLTIVKFKFSLAAIFFKNRISRSWDISDREVPKPISEQDRVIIKQNILQAIVQLPPNVRVQLVHCLGTMLSTEYPDKWPEFIPHVQQLLQSGNHTHVFGGLLALLEVVKTYQYVLGGCFVSV